MAEITKQALQVSNNTSFPNNNAGAITPSDLRAFNVNMIDSLVDEIGYNADSASWNSSISNLNTFTGSQQPSFTALNAFTASQLNINSGVNTFTQSATGRLNNLEAYTASFSTSVGIYDEGVFVNNVNQINFSGNGITASYVSGKAVVSVDFTSLNNSTASQQISIDALNVNSASVNTSITNINSTTASLNTSASLALVTASFNTGTRNLTFTKGDTTQFSVNIPDVSGSAGDFVTTSSFNAYTASTDSSISQLNASSASQQISIDALNINSASVNVSITNLNSTTSSFATSISNLNSATQSLQSQLATIGGQSGSWVTESETGSFARIDVDNNFTANQTFTNITAVSASFTYVQTLYETASVIYSSGSNQLGDELTDIQTLSGSVKIQGGLTINGLDVTSSLDNLNSFTASQFVSNSYFATTGSNTFVGTQTINADAYVSGNTDLGFVNIRDLGGINLYGTGSGPITSYGIVTNPSNGDLVFNTNPGNGRLMTFNQTDGVMNLWNGMKLDTSFIGIDVYDHPLNLSSSFGGMTTMLTTQGNVVVSGSMVASGSAVVTGSLRVTGSISTIGSVEITGSLSAISKTNIELGSDNGIKIGATAGGGVGIDVNNISMQVNKGVLSLAPSGFTNTTGSLLHLSSSSNSNFVNLVFKSNNNTGDTIISGSNNIFVNPPNPTAGFKRYIGGFGNYFGIVPQLTGSAAFSPSMINNIINTGMLMRLPVSSSAYTMNGNILNNPAANGVQFGTAAASNFEKAVSGLTFNNNNINGTLVTTAFKTPLSASVSITNNNIGGIVSLNMDSSSISLSNTLIQGNLTVNNSYFPSTITGGSFLSLAGIINTGGNSIYASGSNTTSTQPRSIAGGTTMMGVANVISASLNGDNAQIQSTHLIGYGLNVIGSNIIATGSVNNFGSVFVGRNNSIDGDRNKTAETIFAVGTGNLTTRKTGFLIDSGSNTFVEGTLNVSGSTSLTGSLTIQSGSSFFANGNKQFNVGAFYSTVTQSGSAAVSQSMTFNTTDISEGVTLNGGGTQFILANSGTYNIQFSAQILADTGADDVWIWLKKNGTNVSNSAGRVTLANNEELMAAWNYVVTATAGDYFELVWESSGGDALLLYNTALGNYPAVPSVIATVTQVR